MMAYLPVLFTGVIEMLVQAVERIRTLLPTSARDLPLGVTLPRLLHLVDETMGEDMRRYPDGRMLIWDIARHDGYNIPAYPMAGCGDVREFLADEGVRTVPEWYERHLGRMLIWDIARHDGYNIPAYPMAGCGDVREFLADEGVRTVPEWYERHLEIGRSTYDEMYAYELVMVRNRALWRKVFTVPVSTMNCEDALLKEIGRWLDFGLGSATSLNEAGLFKR